MFYYTVGWFLFNLPYWGFIYWTPTIVDDIESGEAAFTVVLISSLPYVGACIGNIFFAYSAQTHGRRLLHQLLSCLLAFVGFMIARFVNSSSFKIFGLMCAGAGLWGNYGPLWSMISEAAGETCCVVFCKIIYFSSHVFRTYSLPLRAAILSELARPWVICRLCQWFRNAWGLCRALFHNIV